VSEKPIQLGYARPMPPNPGRVSPFTLILSLLLTIATSCLLFVMVAALLAGRSTPAVQFGMYGAGVALLALLLSLGRARAMLGANLAMLAAAVAGILVGMGMA
jgi:hypothetical protein